MSSFFSLKIIIHLKLSQNENNPIHSGPYGVMIISTVITRIIILQCKDNSYRHYWNFHYSVR